MSANVGWHVEASLVAQRTSNPIRKIVDQLKVTLMTDKVPISLSIGDPTVFGNFEPPQAVLAAVHSALDQGNKFHGYAHSCGYPEARASVAKQFSSATSPLHAEDVILCSGASGALDMCISVLANEGDNILVPQPAFSLYKTLCDSKGVECRFYRLQPEKEWEADTDHMRQLITPNTKAVLVNNPSNPCGSVYSEHHLRQILKVAEDFFLPVIADEIYAGMTFTGHRFFPLATLSSSVPVLAVGGLAKQYIVPGWRMGWILIHDRNNVFADVRQGLLALSTLILGPNSVVQGALSAIFEETPASFYSDLNSTLEDHAKFSVEKISKIPGLRPVVPRGAMYMMVGLELAYFADIASDVEFAAKLLEEESVMVLPGQCFNMANFFRIVFCPPVDTLEEAYDRLREFCLRHSK